MDMSKDERQAAWAALRMVRDAVGELFGPVASIESEEAVLHRGPEYQHEAEAIVAALHRVAEREQALAAHVERLREQLRDYVDIGIGYRPIDAGTYETSLKLLDETPTTSLARLKAQWQAEVVELVRSTMRAHGLTEEEGLVNTLSQALSRQSEKMNSWPASTNDDGACSRIKARWQIEALESVRKAAMNGDGCVSLDILLIDRINRLRRHAEEGESHDD